MMRKALLALIALCSWSMGLMARPVELESPKYRPDGNGGVLAEDVMAVLDYAVNLPWADKGKLVIAGQSHGGWITPALGALDVPGVIALNNFAGGLRQESCNNWQTGLAREPGSFDSGAQSLSGSTAGGVDAQ